MNNRASSTTGFTASETLQPLADSAHGPAIGVSAPHFSTNPVTPRREVVLPIRRSSVPMHGAVAERRRIGRFAQLRRQILANGTRLLSLLSLGLVLGVLANLSLAAYHAIHDPMIAPLVLSPDSELVVPSKLTLTRILGERSQLQTRLDESGATLRADEQAIVRLRALQAAVSGGLKWNDHITSRVQHSSATELRAIGAQKRMLRRSILNQQNYIAELRKNLAAGLVRGSDVEREGNELNRLQVELLQLDRDKLAGENHLHESNLAQAALHRSGDSEQVLMPEMVQQSDHLVHIELELLKLETDKRSRASEADSLARQLKQSDELIAQVRARPIFRAIDTEQNVAFVPYSELDGVGRKATLYECKLWGFFFCEQVGHVSEVLPGEVSMQDPWGNPARGRYALLTLDRPSAARAKVLHVRAGAGS